MKPARTAAALGLLLLATVAMARVSHTAYRAAPSDAAVLRVAWSARPERIEKCERQSDSALALLAPHMRQRYLCEGTTARYRLEVRADGVVLALDTVQGGGLRHDRQLYVARDLAIAPGTHRVSVRFVRIDSTEAPVADDDVTADSAGSSGVGTAARAGRERDERRRRREEAVPAVLLFEQDLTVPAGSVRLITYDPERHILLLKDTQRP